MILKLKKHTIDKQNSVIARLKESGAESKSSSSSSSIEDKNSKLKISKAKGETKEARVEDEKERQFKLLQAKLRGKGVDNIKAIAKYSSDDSSDDGADLKALKKKMSRKQRDRCNRKVSSRLKKIGATFPDDDFETTTSAGTDSDSSVKSKCKHRQVKSGAKVKKRPVIKTELWPHTIANEDDGEDVTSDNIGLAKFFACFTFIMTSCGLKESQGRSALLHAVSTVLEYLQWSEAHIFHNMMMVKIEQGKATWATDFSSLAESFVDKKVRLSLKARNFNSNAGSSYKGGNLGKSFGKGFKNQGFKGNTGRGRPLYGAVCYQWNFGTCTYGNDCKRWHICKTCAESGKMGEYHKASSHDSSSRSKPRERV